MTHSLLDGFADDLATSALSFIGIKSSHGVDLGTGPSGLHVGSEWFVLGMVVALPHAVDLNVAFWDVDVNLLLHVDLVWFFGAEVTSLP